MGSDNLDTNTVDGFLNNDPESIKRVMALIDSALRKWQVKFGYESDDIKSDVMLKLLLLFRKDNFTIQSSLPALVNTIVYRTCIGYYRFNKLRKHVDIDDVQVPDGNISAEEKRRKDKRSKILFRVLRLAPKECIKLWHMQLKEGLTCREIGKKLGKSEETIRWKLFDCRKRVRKLREKIQKNTNDF